MTSSPSVTSQAKSPTSDAPLTDFSSVSSAATLPRDSSAQEAGAPTAQQWSEALLPLLMLGLTWLANRLQKRKS